MTQEEKQRIDPRREGVQTKVGGGFLEPERGEGKDRHPSFRHILLC